MIRSALRSRLLASVPTAALSTAALLVALPLTACSDTGAPAPEAAAAQAPEAAAAPTPAASAVEDPAAGLAPVTSRQGSPELGEDTLAVPGAVFTLPAQWQREAPSSSMRLAQMVIPGEAGDGLLTVFHFGPGGGGGVEANIQRWVGQIEADAGTEPSRAAFAVDSFQISWVETHGTLKPSTMGMGNTEAVPGSTLMGAVVEGAQGPWFFKATGPSATLDAHRDSFLGMLKSVRAE